MKVHNDLKELLIDFSIYHHRWLLYEEDERTITELTKDFLSINSLALGKPEPLAKNKQCDDDFFCEWSEAHDMDNQKCETQCIYCKSH